MGHPTLFQQHMLTAQAKAACLKSASDMFAGGLEVGFQALQLTTSLQSTSVHLPAVLLGAQVPILHYRSGDSDCI